MHLMMEFFFIKLLFIIRLNSYIQMMNKVLDCGQFFSLQNPTHLGHSFICVDVLDT